MVAVGGLLNETISVTINGTIYQVPKTFSEVSLNDYLRSHLQLTGTKVMCREGGCGACVVHVAHPDPDPNGAGQMVQMSVNSCLCPILSCDGWEVTTVEGIGSQKKPHPIQTTLTEHYGTQCGYCTPGMVMSMYSLLQNHPNGDLSKQQVEDSFGGNICRCTGYRPILDAFKSFAKPDSVGARNGTNLADVEDFGRTFCKTRGSPCTGACNGNRNAYAPVRPLNDSAAAVAPPWFKPADLPALFKLMPTLPGNVYYIVGHTGKGVYNDAPYGAYVDLKGIGELYATSRTANALVIGANVSLTNVINLCNRSAQEDPGNFLHLKQLAALISKTAHPPVRNAGSWAGNFAMKNKHKDMPSDSFFGFTAANARLIIRENGGEKTYSTEEFLNIDLNGKLLLRAELPSFTNHYVFRNFKVMIRSQNTHAYVIAAFRAKVTRNGGQAVISEKPVLAYGNIAPQFVRAKDTETFLTGKNLADPSVLQQALNKLNAEVVPDDVPSEATPDYKRSLSVSLLYKFALEVVGDAADPRYRSAVGTLKRPLSSGSQSYQTNEANYPLTQPIPKLESMVQCTGEAKYISDIEQEGMLHAAFVLSIQGNATLFRIDSSAALTLQGVIQVLVAKDIPGVNSMTAANSLTRDPPEEFLASSKIFYAGQPIAVVVAVSRDIAEEGAKLVKVSYSQVQDAVTTVEEAVAKKSFYKKLDDMLVGDAVGAIANAPKKISGEMSLGGQYHYYMETQVAVSYPTEDGLTVEAGTQWLDNAQSVMAQVTGLNKNQVHVIVKRNGGGFGGKIIRNNPIAAATALAAYILQRPVKMHMNLWDNLKAVGKRYPYYYKYQAGFDEKGKIQGLVIDIYGGMGGHPSAGSLNAVPAFLDNAYKVPAWKISRTPCNTNLAINTATRAPGSTEFIFMMENIMEHVAQEAGLPTNDVKMANFCKDGDVMLDGNPISNPTILSLTNQLLDSCNYASRAQIVDQFNKDNRWRKRGLNVVPMRYPCNWSNKRYGCLVTILHDGGFVSVTHGGVEIGQGINTKVAQVVAHELGIDLKLIKVDASSVPTSANSSPTGGSTTSEITCMAAIDCCAQLKSRLNPKGEKLSPNASWKEQIDAAYAKGVNLTAWAWAAPPKVGTKAPVPQYHTYGAMCTEIELDILTGEYQILRMDVLYDSGESMSPLIDIGQVEGAIIMGLGYYTCEELRYNKKTGENLTFSTWTYKPPTTKDIPIDFRVALLQNAPNPSGVLRSKIVGEPPLCMTASVVFALRNAIRSHLAESKSDVWFRMDTPVTPERAQQCCALDLSQLRYSPA